MKAVKIKENVYWVGAIDWKLREFHGYQTNRGSTYNAYLIIDKEITLIDTVKAPFTEEMISRIESVCRLSDINNIIVNHAEPDHSGALPKLIELVPQAKIYASSPNGGKTIALHYGDVKVDAMATGSELNIGDRTLKFVTTPMVHWPDSMVTYSEYDKILFSNDAFGQHYAGVERVDVDADINIIMHEAKKYYANIVLPYSSQVQKALATLGGLDIEVIAPSHGVVWTRHIPDILKEYIAWSKGDNVEKALIVYDTMWGSTEKVAKAISDGFIEVGVNVKLMDLQNNHISDVMTEVMTAKYICIGSPTLNNNIMPTVASMICYLKGLAPCGEHNYIAFGSYGWGGQSVGLIDKELESMKFNQLVHPIKVQYVPTSQKLTEITEMVANAVKVK